jgi:hypothetical protein
LELLGNFQYFVDGNNEDAENIEDEGLLEIIISYLLWIFSQEAVLVETRIHVDEQTADEDEDRRRVQDLEDTLVAIERAVVFLVKISITEGEDDRNLHEV